MRRVDSHGWLRPACVGHRGILGLRRLRGDTERGCHNMIRVLKLLNFTGHVHRRLECLVVPMDGAYRVRVFLRRTVVVLVLVVVVKYLLRLLQVEIWIFL